MKKNVLRLALGGLILVIIGVIGMSSNKFNFGDDLTEYHQKWNLDTGTLSHLVINSEYDTDIEFVHSTDGTQSVEIQGALEDNTIKQLEQIRLENGKLEINMVDDSIHFISVSFTSHKVHLTVSLPKENPLTDVNVDFNSSNGTISNLTAQNVELATSSGNMTVQTIIADQLKVDLHSGNGKISNLTVKNADLTASSGNMTLQSIIAKQLKIDLHSGNLTGTDIQSDTTASVGSGNTKFINYSGIGNFSAESGNIKLVQKGLSSLELSSKSGNVTVTPDPNFKGSFDLITKSGSVHSPESLRESKDLIKVRTNSGNIKVTANKSE